MMGKDGDANSRGVRYLREALSIVKVILENCEKNHTLDDLSVGDFDSLMLEIMKALSRVQVVPSLRLRQVRLRTSSFRSLPPFFCCYY